MGLERWPDNGVSLTYGPLNLAFPVPTRAEIETENSTVRQQKETLRETYEARPIVVKPEFPAWNLYPAGPWNYALHVDESTLKDLTVEWNDACADPFDAAHPALKMRVKASRVRNWRITHVKRIRQFGHWVEDGKFCRGWRTLPGDYVFTPGLPKTVKLAAQPEEIELIPYAATLLRVTVFPQAGK